MSKSVLISIRPKWCEKILNGDKTIEVRKNRPKLETPFKCYIYCTLPRYPHEDFIATDYPKPQFYGGGKVIGEFTCDRIYELAPLNHAPDDVEQQACLTREEIVQYLRGTGYGWHITAPQIYDTPKELEEFWAYNEGLQKRYDAGENFCCYDAANEYGEALTDCGDAYLDIRNCYRCWSEWSGWCHRIKRPPQSWCYVVDVGDIHNHDTSVFSRGLHELLAHRLHRIQALQVLPDNELHGDTSNCCILQSMTQGAAEAKGESNHES